MPAVFGGSRTLRVVVQVCVRLLYHEWGGGATMTDAIKQQLAEAISIAQEVRRRTAVQRPQYVPNPGQARVHASGKKVRAVFSGNGSGKTTLGAQEAMWGLDGYSPITKAYSPVPARVIVVLDHPSKADDVWMPELRKWFSVPAEQCFRRGTHHTARVARPNGSEVLFMSHAMDPLVFESIEADVVIFDEPPPRHVYVGLVRGGRKKGRTCRVLLLMTPITQAWLKEELWDPWAAGKAPDTDCFRYDSDVNRDNLAEGWLEWFGSKLSERERLTRLKGEFFNSEGLAFAHLVAPDTHLVPKDGFEWPPEAPCVLSIDPHPVKAHVAGLMGADREGRFLWLGEVKAKTTARQFAREHLIPLVQGKRVVDAVCDCLGSQEGTSGEGYKSFIDVVNEELARVGIVVRPTRHDDKIDEDFVERARDALALPLDLDSFGQRVPQCRILEGCDGLWRDVMCAEWTRSRIGALTGQDYKPKVDITKRDFLACWKYALAADLCASTSSRAAVYVRRGIHQDPVRMPVKSSTVRRLREHPAYARRRDEGWRDW